MKRFPWLGVALSVAFGLIVTVPPPGYATVPGPNGRILFNVDSRHCDDCHLTTIDPDGTDSVRIEGFISSWSPDGGRIATVSNAPDGRIAPAVMDADGSGFTLFDLDDPTLSYACLAWLPDGSLLLCEGWDETRPHRPSGVFQIDSTDGSGLARVTSNPYGGGDIPSDVSPDGSRFVFAREDPSRHHRHISIWIADIDGSNQVRISPWLEGFLCCQPDWSPDGSTIVYSAKGQPVTVAPDGTDRQVVELDPAVGDSYSFQPHWSPDGTRIVLAVFRRPESQSDIWTIAADGTDPIQVTDSGRSEQWPDWGPSPTVP